MSHMSCYNKHTRQNENFATPGQLERRQVTDFYSTASLKIWPRRYSAVLATPGRKQCFQPDLVAEIEEEDNTAVIREFVGQFWQVYRVSPLFHYVESQEPAGIKARLEANLRCRTDVLKVFGGSCPKVTVDPVRGLRGHRDDAQALKIQVKRPDNPRFILLTIFLVSVNARESDLSSHIQLPCCLCRGKVDIARIVFSVLEARFDCVIYPLNFREEDLMWMSALWLSFDKESQEENKDKNSSRKTRLDQDLDSPSSSTRSRKKNAREEEDRATLAAATVSGSSNLSDNDVNFVAFRFELVKEQSMKSCGLDHADLKFNWCQIRSLWQRFHDPQESEVAPEEMEAFHRSLKVNVRRTIKVNLDKLRLTRIRLPTMIATSKGKLRLERVDKVKTVLSFLTDLCQGTTLTACPTLSTEEYVDTMDE